MIASNVTGQYTDTFGERFVVARVPSYGTRTFYVVTSFADGSEHRASETLVREWIAAGYFRAVHDAPVTRSSSIERSTNDTSATVMIGGR